MNQCLLIFYSRIDSIFIFQWVRAITIWNWLPLWKGGGYEGNCGTLIFFKLANFSKIKTPIILNNFIYGLHSYKKILPIYYILFVYLHPPLFHLDAAYTSYLLSQALQGVSKFLWEIWKIYWTNGVNVKHFSVFQSLTSEVNFPRLTIF